MLYFIIEQFNDNINIRSEIGLLVLRDVEKIKVPLLHRIFVRSV
ncbi:hypothetical protein MNBD_GAMMA18-2308 [hydrothermal vent metagenome]|uniref:Uncharacterized protein n=1 Tax=hydrothermal vent metagenome TaxID=652676 RepID=A0A3B0ZS21_9ZZZZ